MSHWTLHLCSQRRRFAVSSAGMLEQAFNVLQGSTSPRTSELKWGSRMHVLIEGSLNRLHCCGNETPAANEDRLDCFLGRGRAKTSPPSQSVNDVPPPNPSTSCSSSFRPRPCIAACRTVCCFTPAHKLPQAADNNVVLFSPPFAVQLLE